MATFHDHLAAGRERGGFSTDEALHCFLPLARQVVQAHDIGMVAPLDGLDALQVDNGYLWFPQVKATVPTRDEERIRQLDGPVGVVEILGEHRCSLDVASGSTSVADCTVASREEAITRPVYLPGYVSWDLCAGHHDELTDVFLLGQILVSLSCGLDLNCPDELAGFVEHRRNLFRLHAGLHPVVAKAIVCMTELSRHQRPQDLATVVHNLEHYREQAADVAFDLAAAEAAVPFEGRRRAILAKLQERLFELSRRNRLLHFRPTMQDVNLTLASVPLSFDVHAIRLEQLATWRGELAETVSAGKPVSLNRHLNFAEQLYLPSLLDRIRLDAQRDAVEFGFSQLRLALCFLRWANVKEKQPERYVSPFVLLPVRILKKKGVRDTYWLHPQGTDAEVNPLVRYLFKQQFDISLPETVDLTTTTLDDLYDEVAVKVTASEPAVMVTKVERPRIELVHEQARRRVERYRRNARLSGRGVRSFLNIDYCYDAANYHPLGLAIFGSLVRPNPTHLREVVQESPAPRHYAVESHREPEAAARERQFFTVRDEADDNPFHWDFDLCHLTVGNFKYRKMTLVRDFTELLNDEVEGPAFDQTFSLAPRPIEVDTSPPVEFDERHNVVVADPTQAEAVGLSRRGPSYIIQGPPGTGKSQTITNLVADFVARGCKVLFVCAKRAAIDVVHARLRQQGLGQLCCVIHDSQTDKKDFVLDLKATYEAFLAPSTEKPGAARRRRSRLLEGFRQELDAVEQHRQAMATVHDSVGVTVRELLERAVELAEHVPDLPATTRETLPDFASWNVHVDTMEQMVEALTDGPAAGILADHPLSLLAPQLASADRPTQTVETGVRRALELVTEARPSGPLDYVQPAGGWTTSLVLIACGHGATLDYLARHRLFSLLDEGSTQAAALRRNLAGYHTAVAAFERAKTVTHRWRKKLPPEDTRAALEQARRFEAGFLPWLRPSWWRLRRVLKNCYDFAAPTVAPSWTSILAALEREHAAAEAVEVASRTACDALGLVEPLSVLLENLDRARSSVAGLPSDLVPLHRAIVTSSSPETVVAELTARRAAAEDLRATCSTFLVDVDDVPFEELASRLATVESSLDQLGGFLYCLGLLAQVPSSVAVAVRTLALDLRQLEAAVVARAVERLMQQDRHLLRFTGAIHKTHRTRLGRTCLKLHGANADVILERARQAFLDAVRTASMPSAELKSDQKTFKGAFNRGRRELEHEFGKVMRYRAIRDIVSGESGLVVGLLKPIWLMSPLSVSDTLPLTVDAFDVVIFDEASQITLEEAVPTLFRARQAIVVGDEMQLPPTDFFSAKSDAHDDEGLLLSEDGQTFEYDLSSGSFLNHAAKNLPARMLGWHYRSRAESLIAFSNEAFYQGRLATVPDVRVMTSSREPIVVEAADDAAGNVTRALDRPLSFHRLSRGVYENRRNRNEAEYIARLVRGLLSGDSGFSVGVVAFSEAQQSEIEDALSRLARDDTSFGDRLEAEYEREVDGQYVGLLIRNLENMQGDERDVVILSICYGHGPDGTMRMNFGPINQSGGERRLNVAISRARHHMLVVSSIDAADITNDHNDGAACLKAYLRYAAACSVGDATAQRLALGQVSTSADGHETDDRRDAVGDQIAAALTERGYAVSRDVGMSHFRCDVAVRRHGHERYRLGVLVDTEDFYRQDDIVARDVLRPDLLRSFGWTVEHVLTRDWLNDRAAIVDHLVYVIEHGQEEPPPPDDDDEDENDDTWDDIDESPAEPAVPLPPTDGALRRLEYVAGSSSKFWEVTVEATCVTVRYGRIGTRGRTQTKLFADAAAAFRDAQRQLRAKLAKGYREVAAPSSEPCIEERAVDGATGTQKPT